jgi:hypothetical protein
LALAGLAVNVASTTITVVLGLSEIWTVNPTWGGWPSWAKALLWGLGLHQATSAGISRLVEGASFPTDAKGNAK